MLSSISCAGLYGRKGGGCREADDARMLFGQRVRSGTLRRILRDTAENRTRTERKRTMQIARRIAAEDRRTRRTEAWDAVNVHPLISLRDDVKAGRVPRGSAIVSEACKLDIGDRHYVHFENESPGYLVQLERLYGDYSSSRRVTEAVMRNAKGGGRSGKASRPWKRTRRTTNLYLTAEDLQRAQDAAEGSVDVFAENANGVQCVRYFRTRGWRINAVVRRHMREASSDA